MQSMIQNERFKPLHIPSKQNTRVYCEAKNFVLKVAKQTAPCRVIRAAVQNNRRPLRKHMAGLLASFPFSSQPKRGRPRAPWQAQ